MPAIWHPRGGSPDAIAHWERVRRRLSEEHQQKLADEKLERERVEAFERIPPLHRDKLFSPFTAGLAPWQHYKDFIKRPDLIRVVESDYFDVLMRRGLVTC